MWQCACPSDRPFSKHKGISLIDGDLPDKKENRGYSSNRILDKNDNP